MKCKKLLALGMASLMIVSTCATVLAAETQPDATNAPASGTLAGDGSIEGYVDKNVFVVTLPTVADVNFSIDPQELKLATDNTYKVDEAAATTGYGAKVLFTDATKGALTKSGDITVVNKSTYAVDVKLDVKVTGLTKEGTDGYTIKMVGDTTADGFAWGTDTAISMKVTPTPGTIKGAAVTAGTAADATYLTDAATGVSVTTKVDPIATVTDAYEVKGTTGSYTYGLKGDVSAVAFNEVTYNLSGAVNTAADWANFNKDSSKALKVQIAYTVDKHVDQAAPSISATTLNYSKAGVTLPISLGAGDLAATGVASVLLFADGQGATAAASTGFAITGFKVENGNLVLPAGVAPAVGQKRDVRITFNDTDKTQVVLKATITE